MEKKQVEYIEKIAKMEKDIEYIKDSQYKMDKKLDTLMDKFDNHIDDEKDRFASKWVETAVMSGIGFTLLAIIGAVLKLVILV